LGIVVLAGHVEHVRADDVGHVGEDLGQPVGVVFLVDVLDVALALLLGHGVADVVDVERQRLGQVVESLQFEARQRLDQGHRRSGRRQGRKLCGKSPGIAKMARCLPERLQRTTLRHCLRPTDRTCLCHPPCTVSIASRTAIPWPLIPKRSSASWATATGAATRPGPRCSAPATRPAPCITWSPARPASSPRKTTAASWSWAISAPASSSARWAFSSSPTGAR